MCGGTNHGEGFTAALENTAAEVETWAARAQERQQEPVSLMIHEQAEAKRGEAGKERHQEYGFTMGRKRKPRGMRAKYEKQPLPL